MKFCSILKCSGILAFGISALLTTGCSGKFPIQKDNILAFPLHIELPAVDLPVYMPEKVFVAEALSGLEEYMIDGIGREKATEFVTKEYHNEFKGKFVTEDRIKKTIENALSKPGSYISRGGKLNSVQINLDTKNSGTILASINSTWDEHGFVYIGRIDMSMNITNINGGAKSGFDISSLSYILNCKYGRNTTCIFKDSLEVDDKMLFKNLQMASPGPEPSFTALRVNLINYLKDRYTYGRKEPVNKISKKYTVDFITAKSRLQRALETFKYDDKNSTFMFSKFYEHPKAHKNKVEHEYVISLFPDRNDTVIEFKGKYEPIIDTYTKKEHQFGKSDFDSAMDEYIAFVSKTLNN